MGVPGLWQILQPCGRPIKISTLNRKRLAVDASIWIYQFLKAVRDKEGNALRNSHVVGFFRRICKLLFFGIQPVFVFDGGAPALKRQTVMARKRRREGRRDDAVRTAGRLVAVQMQRRAEEEDQRRKATKDRRAEEEEVPEEGLVYVDEIGMSAQERAKERRFRKKDAYHLPDLDQPIQGSGEDMRMMSVEELQQYAQQFEKGEDINVYDFSKIDYDSPFFTSLPASDRYNILNAARLRSRLRMGHSKEQLDAMYPDRMEFSRFQIERVTERNELTTRLMNINDGDIAFKDGVGGSNRVAGEKAREYVLVKNDGVEGGYALGVIAGDEGSSSSKAIDLDRPVVKVEQESEDEDDAEFEDVAIEGLNRLPKRKHDDGLTNGTVAPAKKRRRGPAKRKWDVNRLRPSSPSRVTRAANAADQDDPDSLFVASSPVDAAEDEDVEEWEEVGGVEPVGDAEEDEQLQQAIAMSLQQDPEARDELDEDQQEQISLLDSFQQRAAQDARPVPKGDWKAIARTLNNRAKRTAGESREITSFGVPHAREDDDSDEDGMLDLQAALAESRRGKRKTTPPPRRQPTNGTPRSRINREFSGPLPFEKLNLGTSILGRKKQQQQQNKPQQPPSQPIAIDDDEQDKPLAGGFEAMEETEARLKEARDAGPMPPWFSEDLDDGMKRQAEIEREDRERAREYDKQFRFTGRSDGLRRHDTGEVIDLEADELTVKRAKDNEVIELDDEDQPAQRSQVEKDDEVIEVDDDDAAPAIHEELEGGGDFIAAPELTGKPVDHEIRMGDMADAVRVEPPTPATKASVRQPTSARKAVKGPFVDSDSDEEDAVDEPGADVTKPNAAEAPPTANGRQPAEEDEEEFEWEASDDDAPAKPTETLSADALPAGGERVIEEEPTAPPVVLDEPAAAPQGHLAAPARSPSPDFEDVDMAAQAAPEPRTAAHASTPELDPAIVDAPEEDEEAAPPAPPSGLAPQNSIPEGAIGDDEFDDFDDPEEEEMLKALAAEAEEHARFASQLNQNKSTAESLAEYEKELKQLRNQQKKDRRDADEVTHIMIQECQQLLRLFGLPYVTAPMEAEAQCAELVQLGLVDGIVTDDSDCFLFGGTRVYKNFFNQAKFVECYLASDLQKEFDLTREKMISVAQLLGSDYTEGLAGVGPVTALEIISEFVDLNAFRDWFQGVALGRISKEDDAASPFRKKFRKTVAKTILPPSFPDPRVEKAYLEPEVDSDPQQFQWGVPDLEALRRFLMATIGWSQERTDEVLLPVIQDMNRRADEGTQANITAFFDGGVGIGAAGVNERGEAFAPRKRVEGSKRMGKALGKMAERAKVQRTISQGGGVEEHNGEQQVVDMSGVEVANGDGEAVKQSNGKTGKGRKRAAAAANTETGDDKEDGSEFEQAQPKKKGRKTAAGGATGGRGRRKKAVVEDD